jgi:hypothetical protein
MKQRIIWLLVIYASAAAIILLLPLMQCSQKPSQPYHNFLQTEAFKRLPRIAQVQKCATCHKQEFDNEMAGPHAAAFRNLTAHRSYVNSTKYDCAFYTVHVNESFEHCKGCHSPQNLYETLLFDSFNNQLLLAQSLLKIEHPRPLTRMEDTSQNMSIDCMNCHYNGNEMVSLKHIPAADDSVAEKQTLETLTANNLNCYLCHADVVRNFSPAIAIAQTGSALCVNCHTEKNAQGIGTHYFYWQHDSLTKHNPKPEKLLNDFSFTINTNKQAGIITWHNTTLPHRISPGPEMVLLCKVLSKDSAVLGTTTIRINKKKQFDEEMYKAMHNNYHRGVLGNDVPLNSTALTYPLKLQHGERAAFFRIDFMHKSQYWFPDSTGKSTSTRICKVINN